MSFDFTLENCTGNGGLDLGLDFKSPTSGQNKGGLTKGQNRKIVTTLKRTGVTSRKTGPVKNVQTFTVLDTVSKEPLAKPSHHLSYPKNELQGKGLLTFDEIERYRMASKENCS